jgi:hypothetical protein
VRSIVLRDHALHLQQQLAFGRLVAKIVIQEDHFHVVLAEFIQQHHLPGVITGQAIRRMHIQPVHAAAIHHVDALAQRCDLTLNRGLLGLLLRADTCVQRHTEFPAHAEALLAICGEVVKGSPCSMHCARRVAILFRNDGRICS